MVEDKRKMGQQTLDTLREMFGRWIKSDVIWALDIINRGEATGEEDEWDFLRHDWICKLEEWIAPYMIRLKHTEYITKEDCDNFGEWAATTIEVALAALYALEEKSE